MELDIGSRRHGNSGYQAGCRCDVCVEGKRASGRGYKKRKRLNGGPLGYNRSEETRQRARQSMKEWWETAPRKHPPDCPHCLAVRRPKPPFSQQHKDKMSKVARERRGPSYDSMHYRRLRRDKGKPSEFSCVECGRGATSWALKDKQGIPDEFLQLDGFRKLWFSTRSEDYEPKCTSCHLKKDAERRRREGRG